MIAIIFITFKVLSLFNQGEIKMNCELCGKPAGRTKKVLVEGTTLQVCERCARHGEEVFSAKSGATKEDILARVNRRRDHPYSSRNKESEKELALDYAEKISGARLERGLTQEELARSVMEKKSVIAKVEHGDLYPSDDLAKKLESALEIELFEVIGEVAPIQTNKSSSITIGDLLKGK